MTSPLVEALRFGPDPMQADPRGMGRDQRSFGSFSEMMNDPGFRGDWGKIAAMSGPTALALGAGSAMTGIGSMGSAIQDGFGGRPGGGLNQGGMADDLAAFGGSDPMGGGFGVDLDAAGSMGESPGLYAGGGVVDQPLMPGDPPGPDNRIIGAKAGEVVLNQPQQMALIQALRGRR